MKIDVDTNFSIHSSVDDMILYESMDRLSSHIHNLDKGLKKVPLCTEWNRNRGMNKCDQKPKSKPENCW